jgi:hypothetical protein
MPPGLSRALEGHNTKCRKAANQLGTVPLAVRQVQMRREQSASWAWGVVEQAI